ncbi:helix-turn-helix domain-containing protein [Micromonospora echinofusca]|uniref:Helix-turn-helix domain-containing protein n=1 Tax=Micromonospora echinofusca TaxID=47858 RepID=A0ABS3VRH7_MICEH|nr:helix-turn-helix transcriptional regulator [Micromonospora echinofusca]MBO4207122.1 helix-turn-helix domain-containing protein [Micromonospora echinofusca]
MEETGSTVPRRQLGRLLRQSRESAGIGLEAAAAELEWSRAKMYRIESGQAPVRTLDVEQMCRLYDASAELTGVLVGLARESKAKGWYHAYGEVIPAWFELFVGLEATARRIRTYQQALVPGLLQTPEYATVAVQATPGLTEVEVERTVQLRIERQRVLARRRPAAPTLEAVVEEAVLRRRHPTMLRQLDHLLAVGQQPNVSLRVLPLGCAPSHGATAGSFVIFDFPTVGARPADPTTIYHESLTGALYLDRVEEVRAYAEAWKAFGINALNEDDSRKLLETIKEEHRA